MRVRRFLSALCCLAMLLTWLPALPVSAAEPVMSETFDSYSVGALPSSAPFKASHVANGGTLGVDVAQSGGESACGTANPDGHQRQRRHGAVGQG